MYIYLWFHGSYNGLGLFGSDCHFFSLTSEFLGVSEDKNMCPYKYLKHQLKKKSSIVDYF